MMLIMENDKKMHFYFIYFRHHWKLSKHNVKGKLHRSDWVYPPGTDRSSWVAACPFCGLNLKVEMNSRGRATIPKDPHVPIHSRYTWFPCTDSTVTSSIDSQDSRTCDSLPEASVSNPTLDKVHEEGCLTYAKVWSGFRISPRISWASISPKQKLPALFYSAFHSSVINRGCPPPRFSGKSQLRLHLVSCIWKGCFSSNPSDGSLTCLTVSPGFLQLVNCLQLPNRERHVV